MFNQWAQGYCKLWFAGSGASHVFPCHGLHGLGITAKSNCARGPELVMSFQCHAEAQSVDAVLWLGALPQQARHAMGNQQCTVRAHQGNWDLFTRVRFDQAGAPRLQCRGQARPSSIAAGARGRAQQGCGRPQSRSRCLPHLQMRCRAL